MKPLRTDGSSEYYMVVPSVGLINLSKTKANKNLPLCDCIIEAFKTSLHPYKNISIYY